MTTCHLHLTGHTQTPARDRELLLSPAKLSPKAKQHGSCLSSESNAHTRLPALLGHAPGLADELVGCAERRDSRDPRTKKQSESLRPNQCQEQCGSGLITTSSLYKCFWPPAAAGCCFSGCIAVADWALTLLLCCVVVRPQTPPKPKLLQVLKGFAAKSDGKDKLTALVQVRIDPGTPGSVVVMHACGMLPPSAEPECPRK